MSFDISAINNETPYESIYIDGLVSQIQKNLEDYVTSICCNNEVYATSIINSIKIFGHNIHFLEYDSILIFWRSLFYKSGITLSALDCFKLYVEYEDTKLSLYHIVNKFYNTQKTFVNCPEINLFCKHFIKNLCFDTHLQLYGISYYINKIRTIKYNLSCNNFTFIKNEVTNTAEDILLLLNNYMTYSTALSTVAKSTAVICFLIIASSHNYKVINKHRFKFILLKLIDNEESYLSKDQLKTYMQILLNECLSTI